MKTIVFDLDGTLLDSSARHTIVLERCLHEAGCREIRPDGYLSFKADGHSTKEYLLQLGVNPELVESITSQWVRLIEDWEYLLTDALYSDALPTLEAYRKAGCKLYLLSARSNAENFRRQVEHLGIALFFSGIICVDPRHAPDRKAEALVQLGADLMVGDTEVDLKAAQTARTSVFILNRGFRTRQYWDTRGVSSHASLADLPGDTGCPAYERR